MADETYCLIVVLGLPLTVVVIAMLGGCFYRGGWVTAIHFEGLD